MDNEELKELLKDGYEGWWACPYCFNIYPENTMCCGEMHCEEITEAANETF